MPNICSWARCKRWELGAGTCTTRQAYLEELTESLALSSHHNTMNQMRTSIADINSHMKHPTPIWGAMTTGHLKQRFLALCCNSSLWWKDTLGSCCTLTQYILPTKRFVRYNPDIPGNHPGVYIYHTLSTQALHQ